MTKASQFEVGTIVKLKSGGPEMTIQSFSNDGVSVYCQWFAGKKLEAGKFPLESVELIKPEAKGA